MDFVDTIAVIAYTASALFVFYALGLIVFALVTDLFTED